MLSLRDQYEGLPGPNLWRYTEAPLTSAYKLLEPRHMVNVVERQATNRTDGLQTAFFNGVGYESWWAPSHHCIATLLLEAIYRQTSIRIVI